MTDRYIAENIIEKISIIDKLDIDDNLGLLVSVNFYKAFDILSWSFIKKAFEYFNFPQYWFQKSFSKSIMKTKQIQGLYFQSDV